MVVSAAVLSGCLLFCSRPADAHHSLAMYDRSQQKHFTGKVLRFIPASNHVVIIFEVLDDQGKTQLNDEGKTLTWQVETGPASSLARQGLNPTELPAGSIISMSLYPLRDGKHQGALSGPLVRCGTVVPAGGCTPETGQTQVVKFD